MKSSTCMLKCAFRATSEATSPMAPQDDTQPSCPTAGDMKVLEEDKDTWWCLSQAPQIHSPHLTIPKTRVGSHAWEARAARRLDP